MKKILLLLIAFSLLSCSDDDNNNIAPTVVNFGSVTCDGQTYSTNRGYIVLPYNGNDPAYNHYRRNISLAFSDGTMTKDNNLWIYGHDVHHLSDFVLFTSESNPTIFENTTFSFPDFNAPDTSLPTIMFSNLITGIVAQNENTIEYDNVYDGDSMVASGDVKISSFPNGVFLITYSYLDNEGNEVTGSYYGTLTVLQRTYN